MIKWAVEVVKESLIMTYLFAKNIEKLVQEHKNEQS